MTGSPAPTRTSVCWPTVGLLGASALGLLVGCSQGTVARTFGPGTPTAVATSTAHQAPVSSGLTRPADAKGPYTLTRVVDGDKAKVSITGRSVTLRLIGIDTPETKHPSKPVQCFGQEASSRAKALLTNHKVWIQYDTSQAHRDRYGRDLVYAWLDDRTMLNEVMVREGFAHEYTYDLAYRYQGEFRTAQRQAKTAGLGFWSQRTCSGNTEQPVG